MQSNIPKKYCFLIIFLTLLLTGCSDKQEIEKKAYVISIGIASTNDNKGHLNITLLITNPEFGIQQQGGSTDVEPYEMIKMSAADFISIKTKADAIISKNISYDMLQQIVVSEELAKKKKFVRFIYDASKDSEIRRDIDLIVSKEKPEVFFKNTKPIIEPRPHKYYVEKIKNATNSALIPDHSELLNYYRITEVGSDLFSAVYASTLDGEKGENNKSNDFKAGELPKSGNANNTQFAGSALFKDGQMIGILTVEETRITKLLNNTVPSTGFTATISDPFNSKYDIAIQINHNKKSDVKMNLEKGNGTIHINVPISAAILTNHSLTEYTLKKNREKLEKHVEDVIKKKINSLIDRTQNEFKSQPFGLSLYARKKFLTIKEYHQYDFFKKYEDMKITVSVSIKITDYGRQKETPTMEDIRK